MVVVADAGMLSGDNLNALDGEHLRFIVGSRMTKAPLDLASHFRWHGDAFSDGQVIDIITPRRRGPSENDVNVKAEPVWDPDGASRLVAGGVGVLGQAGRAGQQDPHRAGEPGQGRDRRGEDRQGHQVRQDRQAAAPSTRPASPRARRLAGLKGYVTNIPAA